MGSHHPPANVLECISIVDVKLIILRTLLERYLLYYLISDRFSLLTVRRHNNFGITSSEIVYR